MTQRDDMRHRHHLGQLILGPNPGSERDGSADDDEGLEALPLERRLEEALLETVRSMRLTGAYIDAGAFTGRYTLYFAGVCGADHVYAFEARPGPLGGLRSVVSANNLDDRVTIHGFWPTAARRTIPVTVDDQEVIVDCVPLDEVVESQVSFIRIHVDGLEADVLRGARRILREHHPVVLAEVRAVEASQALNGVLAEHGYEIVAACGGAHTGWVLYASTQGGGASSGESEGSDTLSRAFQEMARLNDKLHGSRREAKTEVAQLRSELLSRTRHIHDLEERYSQLEEKLRVAVSQRERLRKGLWMRLGNALVHAKQSRQGLATLPRTLLALGREAVLKRPAGSETAFGSFANTQFTRNVISEYSRPHRTRESRSMARFPAPASLAGGDRAPAERLAELRVASIMDEFTAQSFGPECQLLHLDPVAWRPMLERFRPDLLFVESAWRGQDDAWKGKVSHVSTELQDILAWCRKRRVPTVFWNKEDPVHFATFCNTASLFDVVFTTDFDCVHRYKEALGHDRVYLSPFACQPRAHNPIEKYERKDALCFAGAYYARYPERQRDFLNIIAEVQADRPVEIFDRNFGDTHPDYQFPEAYRHLIQGKLPFDQIDRAYKGYEYAINLNSIKQSQTMFARRVFEVMACNTVTVSNFSRGVRLLLGDLVVATDDAPRLRERIRQISATPEGFRKFKLCALRKVLSEHTYADRLAYLVSRVFDVELLMLHPGITVVGIALTTEEANRVVGAYQRQFYPHKELLLIVPPGLGMGGDEVAGMRILPLDTEGRTPLVSHLGRNHWVATFVASDYYGPHYLSDLALTPRYFSGLAVGKASHYEWRGGEAVLVDDGRQYRRADRLPVRASIVARSTLEQTSVAEFAARVESHHIEGSDCLAIDEMSYCRGAGAHGHDADLHAVVDDPLGVDAGLALHTLLDAAQSVEPRVREEDEPIRALASKGLARLFPPGKHGHLAVSKDADGLAIASTLSSGKHQYFYGTHDLDPAVLGFKSTGDLYVDATPGLNVRVVLLFLDGTGNRIDQVIRSVQDYQEVSIPFDTRSVRLGFRVLGPGKAVVKAVIFGNPRGNEPTRVFGHSDLLVLTNHYPSADDLYRNAFVHRRVVEYLHRGKRADVFCLRPSHRLRYYEYEDIDVTVGGSEALEAMLGTRQHGTVGVHFLDESMWRILEPHLDRLRVFVWVHGAEVQPWHRRQFNFTTADQLTKAKAVSAERVRFWRSVLRSPHPHLRLVFVSRYLADLVQEDLGIELPQGSYRVVHNLIDTRLFTFTPKEAEQRKLILSIRPFASRTYANDLAVQAIVELSRKPFFEELRFHIIGDGVLFEETVAPLRGFKNVVLEKRFLTQVEIASLHKEYGVFLSPTRMDTQGVSRDEAMASGLVPVTSRVAAVPEFVDEECGFLAPPEDASGLASAIEALYFDPARFERMSAASAARVRRQSGPDLTAGRELEFLLSTE